MWTDFPLFPQAGSTTAAHVDALYFFEVAVALIMTAIIFLSIFYFAIRYRRRSEAIPKPVEGSLPLEIFWSVVPLLVCFVMFGWATTIYFRDSDPPPNAMEIYVVGKQWMWKLQHPEGRREINELHVPVGRPVKLTMTTEDVIHSFYVPAFRVKKDVVPGMYSTIWFQAERPGRHHLFCAEYCGTNHSHMIGWVYAMEPVEYEDWLSGGSSAQSMTAAGRAQFQSLGCANCHELSGRCPPLAGVYGNPVRLTTGQSVRADESYIRESILFPEAKVVAGYSPIMPTFQGQVTEEGLMQLIAYIKSLSHPAGGKKP